MKTIKRAALAVALLLAALTLVLIIAGATYRAPPPPPDAVGKMISAGDWRLRVLEAGVGPDVLLIHGAPGLLEDWALVMPELSQRYHVVAYDRPGQGFSEPGPPPHNVLTNADAAHALIGALGLKQPLVVGHSFGAKTAVALAEKYPTDAKALLLVGASVTRVSEAKPIYRLLVMPVIGLGVARVVAPWVAPRMIVSGLQAQLGTNLGDAPKGFIEKRVALWSEPKVMVTLAEESRSAPENLARMAGGLASIQVPIRVINGQNERNYPPADPGLPTARVTVLPDTGHYVQIAHPEAVIAAVDEAF